MINSLSLEAQWRVGTVAGCGITKPGDGTFSFVVVGGVKHV